MKILVALVCLTVSSFAAKKPNFLFVIADDMTHRDIGCYGGQAHTPNIDKLATEGMRFTRCFQAAPMCSPTRHNIYSYSATFICHGNRCSYFYYFYGKSTA